MKKSDKYQSLIDSARSSLVAGIVVLCLCLALLRFTNADMFSTALIPFYLVFGVYIILLIVHYIRLRKKAMAADTQTEENLSAPEEQQMNRQELDYIKTHLIFTAVTLLFMLVSPWISPTFQVYKKMPLAYLALVSNAVMWLRRYKEEKSKGA